MIDIKSLVDLRLNMINDQSNQANTNDNDQDWIFHTKIVFDLIDNKIRSKIKFTMYLY